MTVNRLGHCWHPLKFDPPNPVGSVSVCCRNGCKDVLILKGLEGEEKSHGGYVPDGEVHYLERHGITEAT